MACSLTLLRCAIHKESCVAYQKGILVVVPKLLPIPLSVAIYRYKAYTLVDVF